MSLFCVSRFGQPPSGLSSLGLWIWIAVALPFSLSASPTTADGSAADGAPAAMPAAVEALNEKRWQDALDLFLRAAEQRPEDPAPLLGASVALERLGRVTEALATARKAQEVQPASPRVLRRIAQLQIRLDAPTEALATLEQWRRAAPTDPEPALTASMVLRRIERLDDAVAVLEEALESGAKSAEVYAAAAFLQLTLGDVEAALDLTEQGLEIDSGVGGSGSGDLVLARGLALAASPESRSAAAELLEQALELGVADEAKVHLELGTLKLERAENGCDTEGLEHLKTARRLRPDLAQVHFRLGSALRACGDQDGAVAALREFQRLNRRSEAQDHGGRQTGAALNEAQELAAAGRLTAALERVEVALAEAPDDARAWTLKGKILFSMKNVEAAVEAVREAGRLNPGRIESHYLEGLFLSRSGQLSQARQALERGLAVDSGSAEILGLLAAVLADQGELEAAARRFAEVLRLSADNPQLRLAYAQVLAQLGREDESRRQMELYRVLSGQ